MNTLVINYYYMKVCRKPQNISVFINIYASSICICIICAFTILYITKWIQWVQWIRQNDSNDRVQLHTDFEVFLNDCFKGVVQKHKLCLNQTILVVLYVSSSLKRTDYKSNLFMNKIALFLCKSIIFKDTLFLSHHIQFGPQPQVKCE